MRRCWRGSDSASARVPRAAVDELIADLPYTRRWLDQLFRQATGRTIAEALRAERIERAATLLRETELTTDAIALRCGFSSKSHLATVFKKVLGCSPTAYRRQR